MPIKGMGSICFHPKTSSFAFASTRVAPARTFSALELNMETAIEAAEPLVLKWNLDASAYPRITFLFRDDRREAVEFVRRVNNLQMAMQDLASEKPASSEKLLVRGQGLMQAAMKRLQTELYEILSSNRARLDPESVSALSLQTSTTTTVRSSMSDDYDRAVEDESVDSLQLKASMFEVEEVSSVAAMSNLRSIADCMISSGYAKECMGTYKIVRKSIIDEATHRLGIQKITLLQAQKMRWEAAEAKIKSWLAAVKVLIRTLFYGERILCDHIFASSDSIRDSCFEHITKEAVALLFGFPEAIAARSNGKSPKKLFHLLDMYLAISEVRSDIETVFELGSTSFVRSLTLNSLTRLGESVRASLTDFESVIVKERSKLVVPGGGVHPLTVDTMNHLCILSDYGIILGDIIANDESPKSPAKLPLPELYFDSPDRSETPAASAVSARIAWLIFVLHCKLNNKAKHYKDVSVSYLFLANNLQYAVSRVRTSNLRYLLGDDWIAKHEEKIRRFAANYERMGWGKVFESLAERTSGSKAETITGFTSSFEDAYRRHNSDVVPDQDLLGRIKASIQQKIVPRYIQLYDAENGEAKRDGTRLRKVAIKYSPEDITGRLSGMFAGSR